jgi:hypothetical protein
VTVLGMNPICPRGIIAPRPVTHSRFESTMRAAGTVIGASNAASWLRAHPDPASAPQGTSTSRSMRRCAMNCTIWRGVLSSVVNLYAEVDLVMKPKALAAVQIDE